MAEKMNLIETGEAMALLKTSRGTFWRRIRENKIPKYRLGNDLRRAYFDRHDIEKLLEPRRDEGEHKAAA